MVRMMRKWVLAMLALGLGVPTSPAQTPGPTPSAVGAALYPTGNGLGQPTVATLEDSNGTLLRGDSFLDGPRIDNLGWFGSIDLDFLGPHVNNRLSGVATAGLRTDAVALPSAELHWAVSPRFEVGYRFGQGAGEVLLSYRFVNSDGSATIADFGGAGSPGQMRSRLNMNVIDLDYGSQENSLLPGFDMKWRVGVRMATLFFDSDAASPRCWSSARAITSSAPALMRCSNFGGPCGIARPGVFVRVDGAGVLGTGWPAFRGDRSLDCRRACRSADRRCNRSTCRRSC